MYKMAKGMADRIIRNAILQIVNIGFVRQTILKKRGRFFKAEKRSFNVGSAIKNQVCFLQMANIRKNILLLSFEDIKYRRFGVTKETNDK